MILSPHQISLSAVNKGQFMDSLTASNFSTSSSPIPIPIPVRAGSSNRTPHVGSVNSINKRLQTSHSLTLQQIQDDIDDRMILPFLYEDEATSDLRAPVATARFLIGQLTQVVRSALCPSPVHDQSAAEQTDNTTTDDDLMTNDFMADDFMADELDKAIVFITCELSDDFEFSQNQPATTDANELLKGFTRDPIHILEIIPLPRYNSVSFGPDRGRHLSPLPMVYSE